MARPEFERKAEVGAHACRAGGAATKVARSVGLADVPRSVVGSLEICHTSDMSHMRYVVQLGERGRLVLPAPLRRALGLEEGDQFMLELEDGAVRLVPARTIAGRFQGAFRGRYGGRSLADELLAERREEAAREAGTLAGR